MKSFIAFGAVVTTLALAPASFAAPGVGPGLGDHFAAHARSQQRERERPAYSLTGESTLPGEKRASGANTLYFRNGPETVPQRIGKYN